MARSIAVAGAKCHVRGDCGAVGCRGPWLAVHVIFGLLQGCERGGSGDGFNDPVWRLSSLKPAAGLQGLGLGCGGGCRLDDTIGASSTQVCQVGGGCSFIADHRDNCHVFFAVLNAASALFTGAVLYIWSCSSYNE